MTSLSCAFFIVFQKKIKEKKSKIRKIKENKIKIVSVQMSHNNTGTWKNGSFFTFLGQLVSLIHPLLTSLFWEVLSFDLGICGDI